jgi:5-methylcytosine-specific restriction protein A
MPKRPTPFRPHQLRDRKTVDRARPARMRGRALQTRNARLMADSPFCVLCLDNGIHRLVHQWDHIKPLWRGGCDHETNLQGLCEEHHREKTRLERRDNGRSCQGKGR